MRELQNEILKFLTGCLYLLPLKPKYQLLVEMEKFPLTKHKVLILNYMLHIIAPPVSKNSKNCGCPSWLSPAPTRSALTTKPRQAGKPKIHRYPPLRPFGGPFDGVYPQSSRMRSGQTFHGHKLHYCFYTK